MRKLFKFILCLLFLSIAFGCTPTCTECVSGLKGIEMWVLEVGNFWEYDVLEEQYALGRPAVVSQYQWKEIVAEKYMNVAGQTSFRIARYRRANEAQRWIPDSTFTVRLTLDQAIRNENGKDYVKMLFPPAERSAWNANIYNNLGEDKYEYRQVNKPFVVNKRSFDRTLMVIQQNDSTLVGQDKRLEVYAAGVGMIYRERILLQFCSSTSACVGKAQIDFGSRQYVRFKNTGKE